MSYRHTTVEPTCTLSRTNEPWYEFPWKVQPSWQSISHREIAMWRWSAKWKARKLIRREVARRKNLAGEGGRDRTVEPYQYPESS